MDFEML